MGAGVARAPDLSDATVSRHHYHRGQVILQGPVEEGEALDVEHVNLVKEEDAWSDLRLALLPPLGDLGVDLVPDLGLDLAGVTAEEGEEALGAAVDHVDFVQGHRVNNLLSLLELTLGTLDKPDQREYLEHCPMRDENYLVLAPVAS